MTSLIKSVSSLSKRIITNPNLCSTRFLNGSACLSTTRQTGRPSTESLINWKRLPVPKAPPKDRWTSKKALFGENDYKDLLGDGTYQLRRNVKTGPFWLRGWKGNELQRLIKKKAIMGDDLGPKARHEMNKQIKFLYRKMNRNLGKWYYRFGKD